ncbi:MAG TPA: vanadium-dependent haloperoxidase [Nocardioides sp.]|nr:vanadium-dependent haloperoxidase [Nocardioides sp.]
MRSPRRTIVALAASTLLAPLLLVTSGTAADARRADPPEDPQLKAAAVAVAWQRVAVRTIYTEGLSAPPVGTLYLSFTSRAVYDAAREAHRHGKVAATAAVARAAHDVLYAYFPASGPALDADLSSHLAMIPDGAKADLGEAIGAAAAKAMVASRVGDGRGNTSILYNKAPAPGVWQPPPAMNPTWLGFVKPVVDIDQVLLDGPDSLTSAAYTAEWDEVRRLGSATSTERSLEQTEIARFFANNPVVMYRDALCRYLDAEPLGLIPVTRMFARIDAAVAMSMIESWKWKFGVGFWRPSQAIPLAGTDGNSATTADGGWVALLTVPPYPEYTSGHANATSPFAEVLRQTLGDDVPLVLRAANRADRPYTTLTALEHDALNSRIWGGLHFRDAMEDGYYLGHTTAERVMRAIR